MIDHLKAIAEFARWFAPRHWRRMRGRDGYPCKCCGTMIRSAELCAGCARGNNPFFVADNCGADLRR